MSSLVIGRKGMTSLRSPCTCVEIKGSVIRYFNLNFVAVPLYSNWRILGGIKM